MGHGPNDRGATTPPDIAGYRLSRAVGHGGMSTVWLGQQASLGREVAIKVMLPDALADEVSRRRFENEARTIARLEHPHIVGIYEVGRTTDGLPWYSMPYLPRGHAGQRDFRDDEARVREILRALLSALAFAHARGVVHRDVKAENVLFDEADRPLLADFGIALRRGHGTRVTMTGLAVGSTAYMAPEQARGQQVDFRADLYSLGVLAWEMLTGELPYQADDALAMAIQHAQTPLPKLPQALRHWQRFMDRAMAKSPRKRFHDAQQMLQALEQVPRRAGGQAPTLSQLLAFARSGWRRMPRAAWIPLVLLAAAGAGLLLHGRDAARPPAFAGPASPGAPAVTGAATGAANEAAASEAAAMPVAASDAAPAEDPGLAMHRAAPKSPTEALLAEMGRQIEARRLAAPDGDNAVASLLAAWRAEPGHPRLPQGIADVTEALSAAISTAIAAGNDAGAEALLRAAQRVGRETGSSQSAAMRALRDATGKALLARARRSGGGDRDGAQRAVELARLAGLSTATVERLAARAGGPTRSGVQTAGPLEGMIVLEDGDRTIVAFPAPVTVGEYTRFISATAREPALCREKASLLRMLDPRDWNRPGFDQTAADPVVCVSWDDAQAYAQWRSQRDGQRYRLATAAEAARLPARNAARALSEWRQDCAAQCTRRTAYGTSWRSRQASRTLEPTRGYDDVGFRLVRDL